MADWTGYGTRPDDPRRLPYGKVWHLIITHRWRGNPAPSYFTDELVLAICWEETTFRNIPQEGTDKQGKPLPAVGIGQIEPSGLQALQLFYRHVLAEIDGMENYIPPSDPILAQPEGSDIAVWKGQILSHAWQGIQFVSRILEALYYNNYYTRASKQRSRGKIPRPAINDANLAESALLGYAGYFSDRAAWRLDVIKNWKTCRDTLAASKAMTTSAYSDKVPVRPTIREALMAGMPENRKAKGPRADEWQEALMAQVLSDVKENPNDAMATPADPDAA
jgi:hypothetical protein